MLPEPIVQINTQLLEMLAAQSGFGLVGVAAAQPHPSAERYQAWVAQGNAGAMGYLTDHRAERRNDPRSLLPSARSILCFGMLYNGPEPRSTEFDEEDRAWISRYAWGGDYHVLLRQKLEEVTAKLLQVEHFDYKICVDTAPLLERSYATDAGLGWVGKNACLINQGQGSWYFLGEVLTSLDLPPNTPAPDRCGTCTRCIDACPTSALTSQGLDSRLCISYLTIELRTSVPLQLRGLMANHIFGCDICQDVCPWNRRAPVTTEPEFAPRHFAPSLRKLAGITEPEFRAMFRGTPIERARYPGFLRNVCVAMGNRPLPEYREPLETLSQSPHELIAEHAAWALARLNASSNT